MKIHQRPYPDRAPDQASEYLLALTRRPDEQLRLPLLRVNPRAVTRRGAGTKPVTRVTFRRLQVESTGSREASAGLHGAKMVGPAHSWGWDQATQRKRPFRANSYP